MRATINGREYFDVEEAAKVSRYSEGHVRRLARQKRVKSVKKGTMVFVEVDSLQAYLENVRA